MSNDKNEAGTIPCCGDQDCNSCERIPIAVEVACAPVAASPVAPEKDGMPQFWRLYAQKFNIAPDDVDFDSKELECFIAGVEACFASLNAQKRTDAPVAPESQATPKFNDLSTADDVTKARRVLVKLSNVNDSSYFHDDGYPRATILHDDASACLSVFDRLAAQVARPLPTPTVKQLTAQLGDDKPWTVAEQNAFAVFLARFPNESSQGIISLGDAWKAGRAFEAAAVGALPVPAAQPVKMILHCPKCLTQHIDAPDERTEGWTNPPHRSHLCHWCSHIWRPADVPTEGVAAIETRGSADSDVAGAALPAPVVATEPQPLLALIERYASKRALHSFLEASRVATARKDRGPTHTETNAAHDAAQLRDEIRTLLAGAVEVARQPDEPSAALGYISEDAAAMIAAGRQITAAISPNKWAHGTVAIFAAPSSQAAPTEHHERVRVIRESGDESLIADVVAGRVSISAAVSCVLSGSQAAPDAKAVLPDDDNLELAKSGLREIIAASSAKSDRAYIHELARGSLISLEAAKSQAAPAATADIPQEVREFVMMLALKTGGILSGERVSMLAKDLLDKIQAAPARQTNEQREWDAITKAARALYSQWCDNQGIHSNRLSGWSELTSGQRAEWVSKARIAAQAAQKGA